MQIYVSYCFSSFFYSVKLAIFFLRVGLPAGAARIHNRWTHRAHVHLHERYFSCVLLMHWETSEPASPTVALWLIFWLFAPCYQRWRYQVIRVTVSGLIWSIALQERAPQVKKKKERAAGGWLLTLPVIGLMKGENEYGGNVSKQKKKNNDNNTLLRRGDITRSTIGGGGTERLGAV